MSRFDYVKYDQRAINIQTAIKEKFEHIEAYVNEFLPACRATSLLLTALEEAYMWSGKAIRDDQILRSKDGVQLNEERKEG